jgi:hypothetical protein
LDRLDQLTDRLLNRLERDADGHPLNASESHLDECLGCLDRFVALRDLHHGLAAPLPASRRLAGWLEQRLGRAPAETLPARLADRVRRAMHFRVPAWAVAGMAASLIVFTWMGSHYLERPGAGGESPLGTVSRPDRLQPAYRQTPRTISGVVSSIRDATANGVEAHVLDLKDATGTTYLLFTWGRPTVRPGDAVEIDALFAASLPGADARVYQGVVTEVRRAK